MKDDNKTQPAPILMRAGAELEFVTGMDIDLAEHNVEREYYGDMYEANNILTPVLPIEELGAELDKRVGRRMAALPDGITFGDSKGIDYARDGDCPHCGEEDAYEDGYMATCSGCGRVAVHNVHAAIHIHLDGACVRHAALQSMGILSTNTGIARQLSRRIVAALPYLSLRQLTSHHVHGAAAIADEDDGERSGYVYSYMRRKAYKPVAYRPRTDTFEIRIIDYNNIICGFTPLMQVIASILRGEDSQNKLPAVNRAAVPCFIKRDGKLYEAATKYDCVSPSSGWMTLQDDTCGKHVKDNIMERSYDNE